MEPIAAFAGTIPENYERYLGPFLFEPYALDLVSRLKDKKYPAILELACGTGRVTNHLADAVNHDTLIATDLNPDMIKIAKTKVANENIKWMVADALDLPFPDESFDLVVCQFGMRGTTSWSARTAASWPVIRNRSSNRSALCIRVPDQQPSPRRACVRL